MFGLSCSVLLALELSGFLRSGRAQTADSYYFQTPGVMLFHTLALVLLCAIILSLAVWISFPRFQRYLRWIVGAAAALGFVIVWVELARAMVVRDPRFILENLPYAPINSMGVVGSTVFGAYLLSKLPNGLLPSLHAVLIKGSFIVGAYIAQLILFESVVLRGYV